MKYFCVIIVYLFFSGAVFAKYKYISTFDIETLFKENVSAQMFFSHVPRGLIISIEESCFFDPNNEKLKTLSLPILDEIGYVLNQLDYDFVIEGHSPNGALNSLQWEHDWEISLARANNISRYLIRCAKVSPDKIFTVGFGEYIPFSKNKHPNLNNRIDFVILDYKAKR